MYLGAILSAQSGNVTETDARLDDMTMKNGDKRKYTSWIKQYEVYMADISCFQSQGFKNLDRLSVEINFNPFYI